MSRRVRYWIPAILWAAVILTASSDYFSAVHTGTVLREVIKAVLGHPLPEPQFDLVHELVRKSAHLTEYGIFSALVFRASRGDRGGWKLRWALAGILLAACLGSIDEFHQSFVPSRGPSPIDVGIDTIGAIAAQALIRTGQMLFF